MAVIHFRLLICQRCPRPQHVIIAFPMARQSCTLIIRRAPSLTRANLRLQEQLGFLHESRESWRRLNEEGAGRQGGQSKMPWEGLLLRLGGPSKDQPRYPVAERRGSAWRQSPLDGSLALPTRGLCVRCFGDLGQLHTVLCGFSVIIVSSSL